MAATTEAVYTAAQTTTMMDDTNLNPVVKEKRGEVHLTLTFDGVDINPGLILDAIQTLGTVQANMVPCRGEYSFLVT